MTHTMTSRLPLFLTMITQLQPCASLPICLIHVYWDVTAVPIDLQSKRNKSLALWSVKETETEREREIERKGGREGVGPYYDQ